MAVDSSKFCKWVEDNYHHNENGFFKDIVNGYRVYYSLFQVSKEYLKQRNFCKDEVYKKFAFGFDYDKYF